MIVKSGEKENGVNPVFLDWELGIFIYEGECTEVLRMSFFLKADSMGMGKFPLINKRNLAESRLKIKSI